MHKIPLLLLRTHTSHLHLHLVLLSSRPQVLFFFCGGSLSCIPSQVLVLVLSPSIVLSWCRVAVGITVLDKTEYGYCVEYGTQNTMDVVVVVVVLSCRRPGVAGATRPASRGDAGGHGGDRAEEQQARRAMEKLPGTAITLVLT